MISDSLYSHLFDAQHASVYRLALMLCGNPHVAEEIVAEVFAKVLPRWRRGSVTDPRSISGEPSSTKSDPGIGGA